MQLQAWDPRTVDIRRKRIRMERSRSKFASSELRAASCELWLSRHAVIDGSVTMKPEGTRISRVWHSAAIHRSSVAKHGNLLRLDGCRLCKAQLFLSGAKLTRVAFVHRGFSQFTPWSWPPEISEAARLTGKRVKRNHQYRQFVQCVWFSVSSEGARKRVAIKHTSCA